MSVQLLSLATSLITLAVLVVTALVVWRQMRISQLQTARSHQLALIRMAQERPELRAVHDADRMTFSEWELGAYRNLWMMHLQMQYLTGSLSEDGVRAALARNGYFDSDAGRQWWDDVRDLYHEQYSSTRKYRRFLAMVDDAHRDSTI